MLRARGIYTSWTFQSFKFFLGLLLLLSEHRVVLVLHPVSFRSDKKILQHLSFKNKLRQHTLADPDGRGDRQGHARSLSFIFMQLLGKKINQIIAFSCLTLELAPPPKKILDPPLT